MNQRLHSILMSAGLRVPLGLPNPAIENITSDSRCAGKGTLFLGLPGQIVDGGKFWPQAFSSGAVAAVISSEAARLSPPRQEDPVIVITKSIERCVGELAAAFWQNPSLKMNLIGVTGTNGKTTTTFLIEHLSRYAGKSSALFGTLVNRWPSHSDISTHTTAFADDLQAQLAAAFLAGAELGAMEVSSHALAQQRVAGCSFAGAIFTNLTQDHLDYHSSMEKYFEAKASLFQSPLFNTSDAKAVVNIDDEWGLRLAKRLGDRCWRCSLLDAKSNLVSSDLNISHVETISSGMKGILHSPVGEGEFLLPLLGRFNLMNFLQAVGVLLQQGLPLPALLEGIALFQGVPGRMEHIKIAGVEPGRLPIVLVDYAHTPDGLKNALMASRPFVKGSLICVFGCGGDRDRGKRPQMGAIAAHLADKLILTSDNPRTEDPQQIFEDTLAGMPKDIEIRVVADRAFAINQAIAQASFGDVVLVAGKGHEDYQIVGAKKIHFDDREQAAKALSLNLNCG